MCHNILYVTCLHPSTVCRFFREGQLGPHVCSASAGGSATKHPLEPFNLSLPLYITSQPNRQPSTEPCHNTSAPHTKCLFRSTIMEKRLSFCQGSEKILQQHGTDSPLTDKDLAIVFSNCWWESDTRTQLFARGLLSISIQPVIVQERLLLSR